MKEMVKEYWDCDSIPKVLVVVIEDDDDDDYQRKVNFDAMWNNDYVQYDPNIFVLHHEDISICILLFFLYFAHFLSNVGYIYIEYIYIS